MELIGAAALFLAPEPTTVTKLAGGILAVHGADTASAGLAQVVSCQTRTTLTSQALTAAARALGADPTTASHVALAIEIAVPIELPRDGWVNWSRVCGGAQLGRYS